MKATARQPRAGCIEIDLANGRCICMHGHVDAKVLARVIALLERRGSRCRRVCRCCLLPAPPICARASTDYPLSCRCSSPRIPSPVSSSCLGGRAGDRVKILWWSGDGLLQAVNKKPTVLPAEPKVLLYLWHPWHGKSVLTPLRRTGQQSECTYFCALPEAHRSATGGDSALDVRCGDLQHDGYDR